MYQHPSVYVCLCLLESNKSLHGWIDAMMSEELHWLSDSTVHLLINVLILPSHHPRYYRCFVVFFSLQLPHNLMAYCILFLETMGPLETKAYWKRLKRCYSPCLLAYFFHFHFKVPHISKINLICDCFQALQPNFRMKISFNEYGFVFKGCGGMKTSFRWNGWYIALVESWIIKKKKINCIS